MTAEHAAAGRRNARKRTCLCRHLSPITSLTNSIPFCFRMRLPTTALDIVALDGFLTALAIGPGLLPPSARLPVVWGGGKEPTFDWRRRRSISTLMLRRFDAISHVLALDPLEFRPVLHVPKHKR